MLDTIQAYKEQIDKFRHVEFIADEHVYLINGQTAQSVTTTLKKYQKTFEKDYWAQVKADKQGIDVSEVLASWEFNAKFSKVKGTLVHQFIEQGFNNSQFIYPEELIINEFGYDPIQTPFNQIIGIVQQFLTDIENKMFPVASEFIVGDLEYLVGGTIDQLFYNKKSDKLEIWDWKTNKEIKLESRYFHLAPLNHIPDTELDHYSLQLALYKLIIERGTGLELGHSYIAWFNENSPKYQIYKAHDYRNEAQLILDNL